MKSADIQNLPNFEHFCQRTFHCLDYVLVLFTYLEKYYNPETANFQNLAKSRDRLISSKLRRVSEFLLVQF